jgi:cell division protein FtsB
MKQTGDEIEWVHIPRELHEQITNELEKLKAQKELDRQEIERLKAALESIAGENYDDDDDYENICCRFDEIKRFARETLNL